MTTQNSILLAVDSHNGIYSPSIFVERFKDYIVGMSEDDYQILKKGIDMDVDHEYYWEAWNDVSMLNVVIDGQTYYIYENEDIWLIPEGIDAEQAFN